MKDQTLMVLVYVALIVGLVACAMLSTGCTTRRVMKNCRPMMAEGYQEYAVCEDQWKIWR